MSSIRAAGSCALGRRGSLPACCCCLIVVWSIHKRPCPGLAIFEARRTLGCSRCRPSAAQIEALKAAGVTEVVLAINYQPEVRW